MSIRNALNYLGGAEGNPEVVRQALVSPRPTGEPTLRAALAVLDATYNAVRHVAEELERQQA